ncbi:hypothetical protein QJS10_CPB15g01632 [Acorus calamus]|uniref:Pollen Ole e 1 allergen and extensin family protein n=1 Tax=Acorus calamus TaxID=4465 RepID=A0AAV9D7N1_ACOCL|nr:hypothetical protein QJS10_CPB15g01632 [Acorus calamus]
MKEFQGSSLSIVLLSFFFLFSSMQSSSTSTSTVAMPLQLSRSDLIKIAGYGEERLSSVLVTGTVLCELCSDEHMSVSHTSYVSGASVAVECKAEGKLRIPTATTDEYGDFIVDLPSRLHAVLRLDKSCVVRVIQLPENSACKRARFDWMKKIRLSSVGNGIRVYTAGTIKFQRRSKVRGGCLRRSFTNAIESLW